jgi:HK97 family phage prohead protease
MNKREIRFLAAELRAATDGDFVLEGYAALFNNESKDLGGFRETIAPGAFTRSLRENADVKALFNHDSNLILGRSKSSTLALKEDERGLYFRAQLNKESQQHRDIYASVQRRDIDECSFAFSVPVGGQRWEEKKDSDGSVYAARTLTDVDLFDVSAVTYPAYGGTSVAARSLFPDGEIMEIRSAIDNLNKPAAAQIEKRARTESLEAQLYIKQDEICEALAEKFGFDDYGRQKFYLIETYEDHIIVCSYDSEYESKCFSISYTITAGTDADGDDYVFGDPVPVELDWVPSERSKKLIEEKRAASKAVAAAKDVPKVETRAHSLEHVEGGDGDCTDIECTCQNRMVDPEEVYDDETSEDESDTGDETNADESDTDDDDNASRAAKKSKREARQTARLAELRKAGSKVRTKLVDGKHLPSSQFAYVGDATKTETWKLPIQDAAHVRNALARFNQTQGIPAGEKKAVYNKILAAAKKFGVDVSAEDSDRMLRSFPYTEDEVRERRAHVLKLMA